MKAISNHLGQIIAALAAVALLITSIALFKAPVSDFFNSIVDKETSVGDTMLNGIGDVEINFGITGDLGNLIPDGGTYTAADGTVYVAGASFPETVTNLDVYTYGDYRYTYYDSLNGWKVSLNSDVTDQNQTEYGPILESINNKPITNMENTFSRCALLTTAPIIPSGVESMPGTFSHCSALTTAPIIPSGVKSMKSTFNNCTSLKTYVGSTDADGDFSNYVIPNSVTNMRDTFKGCALLTTAPVIPSGVENMSYTFRDCAALTGTIIINANPTECNYCFSGTTESITLTGSSTKLSEIAGTCSNVIVQQ